MKNGHTSRQHKIEERTLSLQKVRAGGDLPKHLATVGNIKLNLNGSIYFTTPLKKVKGTLLRDRLARSPHGSAPKGPSIEVQACPTKGK